MMMMMMKVQNSSLNNEERSSTRLITVMKSSTPILIFWDCYHIVVNNQLSFNFRHSKNAMNTSIHRVEQPKYKMTPEMESFIELDCPSFRFTITWDGMNRSLNRISFKSK